MPKKMLSECFSLSVEPGAPYPPPPPPPLTKIPGSAQDTTVKSTVLDAQAHLCLLASNALHVVKKTRKDMSLSAISINSALADKEFVLSLHHKLHVSTCINKPNDVHKHNQSIFHSINQSFLHKQQ